MSTQTGIRPNDKLAAFFGTCKDGRYRMLKIVIENEALVLDSFFEARGTWDQDWDQAVLSSIEPNTPCYMLYRLDVRDGSTFKWVLISWSPDSSKVREKMLYASTKATLKKEFGGGQIKDDLYGNVKEDISLQGYKRHLESAAAPGPLSREELEREEVKQAQNSVAVSEDSRHQTIHGIMFPMTSMAEMSVADMVSRRLEYIQLRIDLTKETINLEKSLGQLNACDLASLVPNDAPRYHVFVYRHTHEGDFLNSIVFIYTMPGSKCSIKEKMLYSSCRNGVIGQLEQRGLNVEKKIEVDSAEELTEKFLYEEVHPTKNLHRPKFAKPAPPSRGQRRITKQPV